VRRADFRFDLPESLIAQRPLDERSGSRLLVLAGDSVCHCRFDGLADLVDADDLLVVNDSRVIKARLVARKDSGGRAEVLLERILETNRALCQVRVSKPLKADRALYRDGHRIDVVERDGEFYLLDFNTPVAEYLDTHGEVPLPPYIERPPEAADEDRYQTVYAARPGAVAAPTAGLHFTPALLEALERRGVRRTSLTLHVGPGTFRPVKAENPEAHVMDSERFEIPEATAGAVAAARRSGRRVVAVGTTVVRSLETAASEDGLVAAGAGRTGLYIRPGYEFRVVDRLITNFHLPRSTLLMLVCAFAGRNRVLDAYRQAAGSGFRFYSYGDAMLVDRMR